MKALQRLFIISLAVCIILASALGAFLYVSLIPYFTPIGIATASVVIVGLGCVAIMLLSFTYNRVSVWASDRRQKQLLSRVVIVNDLAAYLSPNGTWEHLSAQHEAAKVPQIAPPATVIESDNSVPDSTILELQAHGLSLRSIEKALASQNVKYHRIQKVCSEAKKD
jgi:hypothetical protein